MGWVMRSGRAIPDPALPGVVNDAKRGRDGSVGQEDFIFYLKHLSVWKIIEQRPTRGEIQAAEYLLIS